MQFEIVLETEPSFQPFFQSAMSHKIRKLTVTKLMAALSLTSVFSLGILSCGGGGEKIHEGFKVINAAHRPEYLNISLEKGQDVFSVDFGEITDYREVNEGAIDTKVFNEDDVVPAVEEELTFESGMDYTYLLTNKEEVLTSTLFTDDNSPPEVNSFKIRCINAAISDEGIDCYLTIAGRNKGEFTPFASDVAILSASDSTNVRAGEFELHLTRNGGSRDMARLSSFNFEAGGIYTVVLIEDEDGGTPYQLRLTRDR